MWERLRSGSGRGLRGAGRVPRPGRQEEEVMRPGRRHQGKHRPSIQARWRYAIVFRRRPPGGKRAAGQPVRA
jgi:hypothetical protein